MTALNLGVPASGCETVCLASRFCEKLAMGMRTLWESYCDGAPDSCSRSINF